MDGVSGFIYPGGDVDALCEKIECFLAMSNEERKEMGMAGRRYIKEHFSRDVVIRAYLKKMRR